MSDTNGVSKLTTFMLSGGLWLTVLGAAAVGGIAWGQTQNEVAQLKTRQAAVDDTIGVVAKEVQKQGEALGRLETDTANIKSSLPRILDTLEKIDDRLDDELRPRAPNPFDRRD